MRACMLTSLRQIDIEFLSRLNDRVNVIPIIAKSDTMSTDEVAVFKQRIMADLKYHGIHTVTLPISEYDDEETVAETQEIQSRIPFAIVGSNNIVTTPDGRHVRGRQYPWGVIEIDNEEHSDFVKLRQMLIRTNMEDLKEQANVLYENYRRNKLIAMGVTQDESVFKNVKCV